MPSFFFSVCIFSCFCPEACVLEDGMFPSKGCLCASLCLCFCVMCSLKNNPDFFCFFCYYYFFL